MSETSVVRSDYDCLVNILKGKDRKYVGQWIVVAGGKVVHHGADKDEAVQKTRMVQDEGVVPLVHYILEKEPDAFIL